MNEKTKNAWYAIGLLDGARELSHYEESPAEGMIEAAERLLRGYVENSVSKETILDAEWERYSYLNRSLLRTFGFSDEELDEYEKLVKRETEESEDGNAAA